jgi:hypothetical protein
MAFRIFGVAAAEDKKGKLAQLFAGPRGVGSLVASFAHWIRPHVHLYYNRFGVQCARTMEAICASLLSACCHGFMPEVVEQGLCPSLVTLVQIL